MTTTTAAQPITPAMWERMPWHPKSRALARLDLELRLVTEQHGVQAEARRIIAELQQQIAHARLTMRVAEQAVADIVEALQLADAAEDAELGPGRLAAATAEAMPIPCGPKRSTPTDDAAQLAS